MTQKIALIEINIDNNYFYTECFIADKGLRTLNYSIRNMSYIDIIKNRFNLDYKPDIVVGSNGFMEKYFQSINIPPDTYRIPNLPHHTESLLYQRDISLTTLKEAMNQIQTSLQKTPDKKFFIKPAKNKQFHTAIISKNPQQQPNPTITNNLTINEFYQLNNSLIDFNTDVYLSEYIDIYAEYRAYILNNEILHIAQYHGNPKSIFHLNINNLKQLNYFVIALSNIMPSAYALDFCMTDNNYIAILECNDAFALGNYGIDELLYSKMLIQRFNEITNNEKYT